MTDVKINFCKCRAYHKSSNSVQISLTFDFTNSLSKTIPRSMSSICLDSIFSKQIDSTDFRFLCNFCLLNSDIHGLWSTTFLFKQVVESSDDVLYFWQRLWRAVGKALLLNNASDFQQCCGKTFALGLKKEAVITNLTLW